MNHSSYRGFYLLFIFYSLIPTVRGQVPHFRAHPFPAEHNAATPRVLLEASDGLLWIGTSSGVFQYNGLAYNPIYLRDSLTKFSVSALYEDPENRIWIGTRSGDIYHFEHDQGLLQWQPEEGTPAVPITGFMQTQDSVFWISTYGEGIYYQRGKRLYNIGSEDGLEALEIYHLTQHRNDHILAATDAGIFVCKIEDGQKKVHHLGLKEGLRDEIAKAIISDTSGNFYVGAYDAGIDYWSAEDQQFRHLTPDWSFGEVSCLEIFDQRELWIGTNGNGLYRLQLESGTVEHLPLPQFKNAKIFDIHRDVEGNIWVVNNQNGVQVAHRPFEQIQHQQGSTQAILRDRQGKLWIGTPSGLYFFENEQCHPFKLNQTVNVISLYEDTSGKLWVGTFGQGLYRIDPLTGDYHFFSESDGLLNNNILSIDGIDSKIWLATLGGAFEIDIENTTPVFRSYTHDDGLGTDFIYKVYVDRQGRTWFGTDGKGLSMLQNGQITNFSKVGDQAIKAVYTITEDHRGHLWFSTAESGIFEYNGIHLEPLTVQKGIRDLAITGLITDQNGNILITHPSGIDILNPETRHLIYYDTEIGLEDIDPALNALYSDDDGQIFIGANDRIIRYTSSQQQLEIHPRTLLQQVRVFFESVEFRKQSEFKADQNSLIFEYIGLWYTAPEKVGYRYKLEGYDQDWIYSKDQQATYSSLPPGNYTFQVGASENGDFEGVNEASYSFTILAPFWQRWWFITLVVLSLLAGLYTWAKWKTRRLQRDTQLQRERVESQMEVLKSQINPHFLFNSFNTLLSLIEEDQEAAGAYVEHLSDFYRSLLAYRQKDLIPLQEELDLLTNFSYLLKKRFNDSIRLDIPNIKGRAVFIPPLTLQMLVENAIKHNIVSRSKPLSIKINIDDKEIEVYNNRQEKLTKEKSTHFGLQSIRSRYALLGKPEVKIQATDTAFTVTLPIIEKL